MYYSIDGKLVKSGEKTNKKIKEDFINIPFFQFTSATNAGLRSTSDINVDKDANIKGDINLDGKMIKGGKEVDISKLSSDVFSVNNLNVDGKSILLGRVGVGSGGAPINNALTVVGLDKYTSDGNRLSTHFGYGQFRIYYGSNNSVDDESNVKYNNRAHLDIGYNIGKIGSLSGHLSELGGAYLQTQIDFVGHTPICINPMGGNVGVGTTNPVNKFHVVGETGLTVSSHKKSGERYSTLRLGLPYTNNHDAYCAKIESYNNHSQNYASDLRFHTHPGPKNYKYADERMRITSNGNIGMGTTNPKQRLDVNGAIRIQQTDKKHNGEGGEIQLAFGNQSKGYRHWHIDVEANNRFRIFKNDAGKVVSGIDITEEGNMSIGGSKANRKLEVAGGLQANSINPFPGNDSGTYYSRWNFNAKKRLTHFICAFQVDHKNIQTTMEIDFSMVYTRSKNGTHNRNQRSAGKLIFNMVSTSPSNKENADRSDGNWYVRYSCDNSNYVVDGQMGTGPGFYFLRKNDSCYLVAAIGQSRSDGGTYTGMFKVNIMDPFLQGFHMFTDNETKKAEANIEPHECHKYDPNNQRPDNYKEDNFPGEYKFVDKDYHTWMKIGDDTTGSASFKQKYSDRKYDKEIKSPN